MTGGESEREREREKKQKDERKEYMEREDKMSHFRFKTRLQPG